MKMKIMMMMALMMCFMNVSYSQPRVDETLPKFAETSNPFIETTEYEYNSNTGKWKGLENSDGVIFDKIEFRTINIDSEKYYIMIIYDSKGAYKYPTIREGFYTYDCFVSYIYTTDQYDNLKKYLIGESKDVLEIESIYEITTFNRSLNDLEISVVNVIKNKRKPYHMKSSLKIKKEDDKTVRFILPIDSVLERCCYGFDKKYFESTLIDFYNLFNL